MRDKFEEHSCEFKNESDCEEELDGEGLNKDTAEELHFKDDKYE